MAGGARTSTARTLGSNHAVGVAVYQRLCSPCDGPRVRSFRLNWNSANGLTRERLRRIVKLCYKHGSRCQEPMLLAGRYLFIALKDESNSFINIKM